MVLPPYATLGLIVERLPQIFTDGTPNRNNCIRDAAVKTIFTALYVGAVEGTGRFLGPVHVYRMTDKQANKSASAEREGYVKSVMRKQVAGRRWYADNSREQIRDETLRDGLVAIGAVMQRDDLATTSSKPRYALKRDFASLFDPALTGAALMRAIKDFQASHLSPGALARVSIMISGATGNADGILVRFPSGESRKLAPGLSSLISQAVIEVFATKFLDKPAVLWLSESGNKVVMQDDKIATKIGLNIQPDKNLPDIILADLGPNDPIIIFVEVVATDGAMTGGRQNAFYALTDAARLSRSQIAFLTAYQDRQSPGFKKTVAQLAWRSFAWFVSEPDNIVILRDGAGSPSRLAALLEQ